MAVTYTRYGKIGKHFASANIDYLNNTIKVVLLTSAYTPNFDTHEFRSDLTNELGTANGHTAGGQALGTKSFGAYDAATDSTALLAADTVWTPAAGETLTARYAAVYKDTGTAATSPLIALVNFGADVSAVAAAFTIDWNNTGGILAL